MKQFRSFVIAALAAATLALLPRGTAAQQEITTDFTGGVTIPTGDISDAVDVGPAFTVGLNLRVHDRVSIRAEGGADFLLGKDGLSSTGITDTFEGPDITQTRLDAGIVLHAVTPEDGRGAWVNADVAGGVHILSTERFERQTGPAQVTRIDVSSAYLGASGGIDVGYQFHESVSAFVGGDVELTFADEDDFANYADLGITPFESVVTFPLQAGLKFHFQP